MMIKSAYLVNVVGKKSTAFLESKGFLDRSKVVMIKNIPYSNIILMEN